MLNSGWAEILSNCMRIFSLADQGNFLWTTHAENLHATRPCTANKVHVRYYDGWNVFCFVLEGVRVPEWILDYPCKFK